MQKLFLLVACLLSMSVLAQETAKAWSGESELSFVKNEGNTVSSSLLAKQSLIYDVRPWRNTLKLEASNVSSEVIDTTTGQKESVRTGEKYYLTEQLDRFITKKDYAFLRGTYEKDRFSGFENQSTAVVGYGRTLFDSDVFEMKAEIGIGSSSNELDECELTPIVPNCGATTNSQLFYFSENLLWKISHVAELGQDLSVEDTDSNRLTRFDIYIKSVLIGNLATKLGYSMKYTDVVPLDKKHKDEELSASIVYSF
jgi:putative salt-induced outer membrane protein